MPFKYVGHLEYTNAAILYTTAAGVAYEIPGSYSGAYPGSTRDSQSVETDSISISIPGAATAQQWSFQAPASSHPAFEDMFDAQTDGNPRTFQVDVQERILFEVASPDDAVAALAIVNTVGAVTGTSPPLEEQFPVNSVFSVETATATYQVVGATTGDEPEFVESTLALDAIEKISMPGLRYGPFLASVDEIGQVDDTGVVMYGVSFTPSAVVGKPTEVIA